MPTVEILLYPVNAWVPDISLLSKSHTEYLLLYYDNAGENVIMDLSVCILIWESHIEDSYSRLRANFSYIIPV